MKFLVWIMALLLNQRGEETPAGDGSGAPGAGSGEGDGAPAGDSNNGAGAGDGQADDGTTSPTPRFGEFGDDPEEAATKLFETFNKTKGDFDNFKKKAGLTESNLASLRKTLEANGISVGEDGQLRVAEKKQEEQRKARFTDEHAKIFDKPVLEAINLLLADKLDEYFETRERTNTEKEQQKQAFISEKRAVETLMITTFPELEPKWDDNGKPTNPDFNQAFYDKATEIWEQKYKSNPLKQLQASLEAAIELDIFGKKKQSAVIEGVEKGKAGKKILGPANGGGTQGGGAKGRLSREQYIALSAEDKEKYDREQVTKK